MKNGKIWSGCFAVLMLFGLFLVSCGGGSGDISAGVATVRVAITDNDTRFEKVVLTIEELGIVASHLPTTYYGRDAVDQLPVTLDVLDFPAAQVFHLADIEVPLPEEGPLCFNQIRFVLAEEGSDSCLGLPFCNYVVELGETAPHRLKTPSAQKSGLKLLTPKKFCVEEGETAVSLVLDFDPNVAIGKKEKKNETYKLKPTGIRIVQGDWDVAPEDYISGTVLLPTDLIEEQCQPYMTSPLVTITADSVTDATLPAVTTLSLVEAPLPAADLCTQQCVDDLDCQTLCEGNLGSDCYYSGPYKLLLPQSGEYDIQANWDVMTSSVENVTSSSEGVELVLSY